MGKVLKGEWLRCDLRPFALILNFLYPPAWNVNEKDGAAKTFFATKR